ncbi:MAG: maleylpyruvate isomerase family mycothiol-dependent enzyme [Candidatus Aminicenantes bacterium]|nr:maleylpyruvate isomerase family mycothiol-dependent enzyme [Candidatus Aminicenantes bacterium]
MQEKMSQEKFYLPDLDPFLTLDQEVARIQSFLDSLKPKEWKRPTRCEGWTVRDLVAHLDSDEEYNEACLKGNVADFISGYKDFDTFNAQMIQNRADLSNEDILEQWISRQSRVREAWAKLGLGAKIQTSIGPYPLHSQIWHITSEYATHGDDMGVFVAEEEEEYRLMWRVQLSLFAVQEKENPPGLEQTEDVIIVRVKDHRMALTDEDFVAAVSARLPLPENPDDRRIVEALRSLA